jgi:hypothetical protein
MNEHRDPQLEALFAAARQDFDGSEITARVLARTRNRKMMLWLGAAAAVLAVLAGSWLFLPLSLFEFAVLISNALTFTLFDVGEGWLAMLVLPVNNLASLLVLTAKGARVLQKHLVGRSYGS